jgi:hypothetical protein
VDEVVEEGGSEVERGERSASISRSASAASQRASGTKHPPTRCMATSEWSPIVWYSGMHAQGAVAREVAVLERLREPAGPIGAVERGTPFGLPVVPGGVEHDRRLLGVAVELARMRRARRAAGRLRAERDGRPSPRCSTRSRTRSTATRAGRRPRRPTAPPSRAAAVSRRLSRTKATRSPGSRPRPPAARRTLARRSRT